MENVRLSMRPWIRNQLLSRENLYAVLLCLAVLLVIILTADQSPQWIYQGF